MSDEARPEGGKHPGARPVRWDRPLVSVPSLSRIAWAALGVCSSLMSLVLLVATDTLSMPSARDVPVDATVGVTFSVMAATVLSSRRLGRGARRLAWTLMVAGVCSGLASLSSAVGVSATHRSALTSLAVQVEGCVWVPGFLPLLTLVPLLYPDGLLPGRLWRWAAYAAVVSTVALTVGVGLYPEPFVGRLVLEKPVTSLAVAQVLAPVSFALAVPVGLVALASLAVRLRRATGLARRQVVVLLGAAALFAVATAAQGVLPAPADVAAQAFAAGLVAVAIGVAVTRHGLYDLDTTVARALVAASLATCLAGAYLTLFAILQALPQHRSALSAALAAGLTGTVIQPLAKRLQAGVDRMYYGHRADPFVVTSALAARLTASGLDVTKVPQIVCTTVVESLRLPGARLSLALDALPGPVASAGTTHAVGGSSFSLTHRGEAVGELEVWPRPGEQTLDQRDEAVLRSLADQVAPAVASLRLHQQLQRSREDLVAARESERLQLRRDLHDGLGATLAGLRLQVETARDLSEQPMVGTLLDSAGAGVAQAVAEVRAITDGLRPAALDELGLARALTALADRVRTPGLHVETFVDAEISATPAIEVAVYRIAAEALANAVRHSGAEHVTLIVEDGGSISLKVVDDGTGVRHGAPDRGSSGRSGLGLASMRQRAEEIGGRLDVTSNGSGTTVQALLPRTAGEPR